MKDLTMILLMILEFAIIFGMVIAACKYDEKEKEENGLEKKVDE